MGALGVIHGGNNSDCLARLMSHHPLMGVAAINGSSMEISGANSDCLACLMRHHPLMRAPGVIHGGANSDCLACLMSHHPSMRVAALDASSMKIS